MTRGPALFLLLCACTAHAALLDGREVEVSERTKPWFELYNEALRQPDARRQAAMYRDVLEHLPWLFEAALNLGNTLEAMGDLDAAEAQFAASLDVAETPMHRAVALSNLGLLVLNRGGMDTASLLRAEALLQRAVDAAPGTYGDALLNLGLAKDRLGRSAEAAGCYWQALDQEPGRPDVLLALSALLAREGHFNDAAPLFHQLLMSPRVDEETLTEGWRNLAKLQYQQGDMPAAARAAERVQRLAPQCPVAMVLLALARRADAEWASYETDVLRVARVAEWQLRSVPPEPSLALEAFESLLLPLPPQLQRAVAEHGARRFRGITPLSTSRADGGGPTRVAYLSFDFRAHAVGWLMRGVLEAHSVPTLCVSYGDDDGSDVRRAYERACGRFADVRQASDPEAAQLVADAGAHVLVDLMGHTSRARFAIAAQRPAPVVLAYLGWPGTSGAPWVDAVVADRVVAPPETAAALFSEKVAMLPGTYQANAYWVDEHCPPDVRREWGLPATGVVFANLNSLAKVEPGTVAVWCQLLLRTPGSVLWLRVALRQRGFRERLLAEAAAHGVSPRRFVFAGSEQRAEHLERLCGADLLVDSLIYGAHTTAADALARGVPVVTLEGPRFAGRVGSSLLRAADMGPLVAHSQRDYVDTALAAVRAPLAPALRARLAAVAPLSDLFDTARKARDLERLYRLVRGGVWGHVVVGSCSSLRRGPSAPGGDLQAVADGFTRVQECWPGDRRNYRAAEAWMESLGAQGAAALEVWRGVYGGVAG